MVPFQAHKIVLTNVLSQPSIENYNQPHILAIVTVVLHVCFTGTQLPKLLFEDGLYHLAIPDILVF